MTDVLTEVDVDARRRISLGRIGRKTDTRYRIQEVGDGALLLTPVVSVPLAKLPANIRRAIEEVNAGDVVDRPTSSRRAR